MTISAVAIDLEGTLHLNGSTVPGATETLTHLRNWRGRLIFTSNNDSNSTATLSQSLREMGLAIEAHELLTPVTMLDDWLIHHQVRSHMLVSPKLRSVTKVSEPSADEAAYIEAVVVGDCRDVCYRDLDRAFRALTRGAKLVGLQRGRYFTRTDGPHLDTGAIVAALEYASGVCAELLGKPAPSFFDAISTRLGVAPHEVLVVGDDPMTDIAGAQASGICSALVRTGRAATVDLERLEPRPDFVLHSVAELPDLLARV